jgi:ATP-dependent helicase HrpA
MRKLKDSKPAKEVADDVAAAAAAAVPKRFLQAAPVGGSWQHFAALPEGGRAAAGQAGAPTPPATPSAWPNCGRSSSATCAAWRAEGRRHARLDEYRWLLEELRVSFFAQELRTPQPVSVKRLDKAWAQLSS